jgi:hypothetical protein
MSTPPPAAPVRVTGDTNIFYYLATGAVTKSKIVSPGEELWATPINVIEIIAGVSTADWEKRRDAAGAIVKYADRMSADPEEHLASLFEHRPTSSEFDWLSAAKTIRDSTSPESLETNIAIIAHNSGDTIKPSVANAFKSAHYEDFKSEMVKVCDSLLPGYKVAVESGCEAPVVTKPTREKLRAFLASPEFTAAVFFAGLTERYKTFGAQTVDPQSKATLVALQGLAPYCSIYGAYLRELLTARRKPDSNDWGDLELFVYLQPSTYVATAERKWWALADLVGLGGRLKKVVVQQPNS